MLWAQFIGQNIHFAVNLAAALVCFAVFWLIFDAWSLRKFNKDLVKWIGFLVLASGFTANAAVVSQSNFVAGVLAGNIELTGHILRLIGYSLIVVGQLVDPIQKRPKTESIDELLGLTPPDPRPKKKKSASLVGYGSVTVSILLPLLAWAAALLYWRRSTTGLERHLKPIAISFGLLGLYEAISSLSLLSSTGNPIVYRLVGPYGLAWWLEHSVLVVIIVIMGRWVWQYLSRRLESQLFIILVAQTVIIFMLSTIGFTGLMLNNIRTQSLSNLSTANRVLGYAIDSREKETASQAELAASDISVISSAKSRDHSSLKASLATFVSDHGLEQLTILDSSGGVLYRGDDPDRFGGSLSSDPLVRRGLIGKAVSSVIVTSGVTAPNVQIVAEHPIQDSSGSIVGVAIAGRSISDAFVDGVKRSSGLDSTVFGGNARAASTLTNDNGERVTGLKETSATVLRTVLNGGKSWAGENNQGNRAYLVSYEPLKDINNVPIGMLLVQQPLDGLFSTAGYLIQLTFIIAIGLLILSIWPVYILSKKISGDLR